MKVKRLATTEMTEEELKKEFKNANRVAEIRLEENTKFARYFFRISAIPYEQIERAFLRVESGDTGDMPMLLNFLVVNDLSGSEHKFRMERLEDAKTVLAYFEKEYPHVQIGCSKDGNNED